MTEVVLLPKARRDFRRAVRSVEQGRPGSGARLMDEILGGLERLAVHPHLGPDAGGGARKLVLRHFPYTLYYQVSSSRLMVLAFLHQRRRPKPFPDPLE